MNKKDICSYNYDELKEEMLAIGEKAFRSKQIYEWLHVKLADDFDEMTNLSKGLREKLKENYEIRKVKMIDHQISKVDPTEKFLFELEDGNMVESVLMKYNYGNSVCISSQAGCRMGCRFCASTIGGLVRSLETLRCSVRSIIFRRLQKKEFPMWWLWEPENRWTIMIIS